MSDDVTFASYTIVVSNATDYKLTIVLAPGVQFYVRARPGDDYDVCQNVGGQATTGIISCDDRNADGSAVAGSQEPACNIVGLGSNYFHASGQATVDAYISLAGRGTEKSTIRFLDAPKFYGRVEAVNIATTYAGQPAQGNAIKMDFCPAPGEGSGSSLKPLSSNYRRGSFEYYYE